MKGAMRMTAALLGDVQEPGMSECRIEQVRRMERVAKQERAGRANDEGDYRVMRVVSGRGGGDVI